MSIPSQNKRTGNSMRETPPLTKLVYRKINDKWKAWLISVDAMGIGTLVFDMNGIIGNGTTAINAGKDFQKKWRANQHKQEQKIQKDILNG